MNPYYHPSSWDDEPDENVPRSLSGQYSGHPLHYSSAYQQQHMSPANYQDDAMHHHYYASPCSVSMDYSLSAASSGGTSSSDPQDFHDRYAGAGAADAPPPQAPSPQHHTSPRQPGPKASHHFCLVKGCSSTFPRYADLQRHSVAKHFPESAQHFFCPVPDCPRTAPGGKPFTRKDKLDEHLREVHGSGRSPPDGAYRHPANASTRKRASRALTFPDAHLSAAAYGDYGAYR